MNEKFYLRIIVSEELKGSKSLYLYSLLGEELAWRGQMNLLLQLDEGVLLNSWSASLVMLIIEGDGLRLWLRLFKRLSNLLSTFSKELLQAFTSTCASL